MSFGLRPAIAGLLACAAAISPIAAQDLKWYEPAPLVAEAAGGTAEEFGARVHALVEECSAQGYQGDTRHCRPLLVAIFAEAHARDLRDTAEWAIRLLHKQYFFIEREPDEAEQYLRFTADEMAEFDSGMVEPLFRALADGLFWDGTDPAGRIEYLAARAKRQESQARFGPTSILYRGAIAIAEQHGLANTDEVEAIRMRAMLAGVLMLEPAAVAQCANANPSAADNLRFAANCAVLQMQLGRLRQAEERLRELLTGVPADNSGLRAHILFQLGRSLMLQERWEEAHAPLRLALDLLNPAGAGKPYFSNPPKSVEGLRVAAYLDLALQRSGVGGLRKDLRQGLAMTQATGLFYGVERYRWSADEWAVSAERLQRSIDRGTLRWEGGVWQSLMSQYRLALADIRQLYGPKAPLVGYYMVKEAEASELFLTEGYRQPQTAEYVARRLSPDFVEGVTLLAQLPPTDLEYAVGYQSAALHWEREGRDPARAYAHCGKAVAGIEAQIGNTRDFDQVARKRVQRVRPILEDCVRIIWKAAPESG